MADGTPHAAGAYGLRLSGVDGIEELLVAAPEGWLPLELILNTGPVEGDAGWIKPPRAEFVTLSGGLIHLDLERGQATLTSPAGPTLEEVVHPYLSSIGAMTAYLQGQEAFHAAAVAAGGGTWAIVGDREAGKSSTLASLALRNFAVVCDDTLVLRGTTTLAGPRSIDLRRDAAHNLGVGVELGVVGTRERWRMHVGPVEPELELRGWIFLEWGDALEVAAISASERLQRLLPNRTALLPAKNPAALLGLANLPGFVVRRPHGLEMLAPTIDLIADTISD